MHDLIELMRERLNYDPDSGLLTYSSKAKGSKRAGDKVGCLNSHGYIKVMFQGRMYTAHRIIWMMVNGCVPDGLIDHINGDKLDNRIENLRVVTKSQNSMNSRCSRGSAKLRGAVRGKDEKFYGRIQIGGKLVQLGTFSTPEEAHAAYIKASLKVHGEFSPYRKSESMTAATIPTEGS